MSTKTFECWRCGTAFQYDEAQLAAGKWMVCPRCGGKESVEEERDGSFVFVSSNKEMPPSAEKVLPLAIKSPPEVFHTKTGKQALCAYCKAYLDGSMSLAFPTGTGTCNLASLKLARPATFRPGEVVKVVKASDLACSEFSLDRNKAFDAGIDVGG